MSIKSDNRHLYLQVIEKIKQDIEAGIYKEKEKLPSEFDLSKQLGVSRATLREALRMLEEGNVVTRRQGVGTFVNTKPLFKSGIEQLNSVTNMIKQAGMTPGTVFLSSATYIPTDEDVCAFKCGKDDKLLYIERVRTANGEPVVYCIDKIPEGILSDNFSYKEESLFDMISNEAGRNILYAVAEIQPIGYHEKISSKLQCEPETALLILKQMHYDENDEPILYSLNYFKADKFSFHVFRKRI